MLDYRSVQTRADPEKRGLGYADLVPEASLTVRGKTVTSVPSYGVGVLARDSALRRLFHLPGLEPITAAISTYIQKVCSTGWVLEGPSAIARMQHRMLHASDFGQGLEELFSRTLTDYLTQDNGLFLELLGDGDLNGPLIRLRGIAHLDAHACTRTGDLEYPVVYTDLNGQRHRLHRTRVLFQADMPDPDERRLGVGFCALSRALSVAQRLFNWSEMSAEFMDNFPASGLLIVRGMAKKLFDEQMKAYEAGRRMSEQDIYHGLITLFYQTAQKEQGVELISFRQLWEGFTQKEFYDVLIDLTAMAFNLDRQELAPLAMSALGSGAQSTVLATKSRGKGIAAVLNLYERLFNRLMPRSVTFRFDFQDDEQDKMQAEIRLLKANTILSLYNAAAKPQRTTQIDTVDIQKPAIETRDTGLLSREEARYMLVKEGIIPRELYENDTPLRPDWQRFDDITVKARQRYGPLIQIDQAGRERPLNRRWRVA